ncbi:MAG: hypothetical protein NC548_24245 [Lachnospiraceae bacterium]|nr:hypothetical protein [Lachnospiraceae bacterium]
MVTNNPYEAFSFSEWWDTLSTTFVSFYFIAFVFLLVALYYLLPRRGRWGVLLAGSLAFYSIGGVRPMITVLLSCAIVYFTGLILEMTDRGRKNLRRFILFTGIVSLAGVLVFTKCYVLFAWKFRYIVPLGISYYTFSAIGYMADVYWRKEKAEKNVLKLLLYLLFFPKILQGPITKYRNLAPQLIEGHRFVYQDFCFGMQLAVWGYFKKIVVADRIAIFTTTVFNDDASFGGAVLLLSVVLAAVQIYCDFSACMDIAGGVSQMFGIRLEKNFDHPFFAKSAAEFWRRWHITLGTWFKDYIYMPIVISPRLIKLSGKIGKKFGRRAGKNVLTVVPLVVVWFLTGLWHGTGAPYLVWGAYWGLIIILSTVFAPEIKKMTKALHIDTDRQGWKIFQTIRTFLLFCMGRLLTIPGDLHRSADILRRIFTEPKLWQMVDDTLYAQGLDWKEFVLMLLMIAILWFVELQQRKGSVREKIANWNIVIRCTVYACSVIFVLLFGIYGPGIETGNFVYMQY